MKKIVSLVAIILIACSCSVSIFASNGVSSKVASKKTFTKTFPVGSEATLQTNLKTDVLAGKSVAVKKINNYFEKVQQREIKQLKDETKKIGSSIVYNSNINLIYAKNNKYSFKRVVYTSIEGAAHGGSMIVGYTFNAKTGKKLKNDQITKYSKKTLKNKIVKATKAAIKKNKDNFFQDALKQVKKMKLNKAFCYLSGKYLCVVFNEYTIAPYATGITTVKIKL